MIFSASIFQEAATQMGIRDEITHFELTLGLNPEVCSKLCNEMTPLPAGFQARHLLWALLFLKGATIPALSQLAGASPDVVSMWVWRIIPLLGPRQTYNENFYSYKFQGPVVFRYDGHLNNHN